MLGNRPYIWEPLQGQYNLFGKLSREYVSYGTIQLERSESLAISNQFERFNEYTGDRVMFFYHPEIKYDRYKDSMSEINLLENTATIELGLSFDQAYSIEEVTSLMPENIDVMWWWVDSYTDARLDYMKLGQDTVSANSIFIYGFHDERFEHYSFGGIDYFINSILRLKDSNNFKWEVDQLYEALVGEDSKLDRNDVKIIGAVVTGTVDQLDILKEQSFIKASTLGVVFDKK